MSPGGLSVLPHPFFLLGRTQTDKDRIRAAGPDSLDYRLVLPEIAVVGPRHGQAGVLPPEIFRRLFRYAGLCAQQEQTLAVLRHPRHQLLGKADAGDTALQGRPQHLCAVNDADAIGQHQVRAVDSLPCVPVLPADLHDLRVGSHRVVGSRSIQQAYALGHRLLNRHIVKANAQHVNSHRRLLSRPCHMVKRIAIFRICGKKEERANGTGKGGVPADRRPPKTAAKPYAIGSPAPLPEILTIVIVYHRFPCLSTAGAPAFHRRRQSL